MSLIFAVLFVASLSWHNYTLATVSWIGIIFDAIDGYVARRKGKVTSFGAFFDSTTDRLSDFFFVSAFGFAGFVAWNVVVFALLTTFLISYIKARAESLLPVGSVIQEGLMQRTERLLLLFVIFLLFVFNLPYIALVVYILFIVLNIMTIIQRVAVVHHHLR